METPLSSQNDLVKTIGEEAAEITGGVSQIELSETARAALEDLEFAFSAMCCDTREEAEQALDEVGRRLAEARAAVRRRDDGGEEAEAARNGSDDDEGGETESEDDMAGFAAFEVTDAGIDRFIATVGADRVLAALDRLTRPTVSTAE